jgi:8-oxo-dGTP diphosphatase
MLLNKMTLKVCLILEQEGEILLLEQTNANGGRHALIGGKVEIEEFATQSLVRECLEEAGIVVQEQDLALVHALHIHKGKKRQMILYFKARRWEGDVASCELKKFKQATWYALDALPDNLSEMTRTVLEHYKTGRSFTCAAVRTRIEMIEPAEMALA